MHNKHNRTDIDEAAANQAGGVVNQIKGRIKKAVGDLAGDRSIRASGARDERKGRLQEAYGDVKEREARLEDELRNVDDGRV